MYLTPYPKEGYDASIYATINILAVASGQIV